MEDCFIIPKITKNWPSGSLISSTIFIQYSSLIVLELTMNKLHNAITQKVQNNRIIINIYYVNIKSHLSGMVKINKKN